MYIESKADGLNGSARIGRVLYSKTGQSLYYQGQIYNKCEGFKSNFVEDSTGAEYWITGPKRDGKDRLYNSNIPIEIDEDVREEYWTQIRKKPEWKNRPTTMGGKSRE